MVGLIPWRAFASRSNSDHIYFTSSAGEVSDVLFVTPRTGGVKKDASCILDRDGQFDRDCPEMMGECRGTKWLPLAPAPLCNFLDDPAHRQSVRMYLNTFGKFDRFRVQNKS